MTREERNIIFNEAKRAVKILSSGNPVAVAQAIANKAVIQNNSLKPTTARATISTTGSVDTTIATIDVWDEQAGLIWVMCFGVNTSGDTYAAIKQAQFKNTGGTLTIGTVTDTMTEEITATGSTLEFDPDSLADRFYLNVNGNGVDMDWEVNYTVIIMDIPSV